MSERSTFGPYTVYECVGSGGMATVHRAEITLGGVEREVALKRLLPHLADEERFVEDFVREAKLAAHLRHSNIVRIYELGRIGETYFIAMELVRGASLNTLIRKSTSADKRPSMGAVFSLMLELTDALDHAHNGVDQNGQPLHLVHRDLTPSNLLVTEDGNLKIIDFGVAKAMTGDLVTNSGFAKGKLGYMSPEAISVQAVDARADIFSVGVVMWELLTGKRLFQPAHDWDRSIHDQKLEPPSAFNRECTHDIDRIVMKAIAKNADDRFQSAEAFHHALVKAARPFAGATNPKAVVRWQRTLRVESNFEPYMMFVIEEQSASHARARSNATPAPSKSSRNVVPRGATTKSSQSRPPSPNVMPRKPAAKDLSRSWPVEPTTSPQIRIEIDPDPEMALVPDTLIPTFDEDAEDTLDTEGTKRLSTKERQQTLQDPPVGRPTRRGIKAPAPTGTYKRKRSPLDTEPTRTVDEDPDTTAPFTRDTFDTAHTPTVDPSKRHGRKPR
ncbi:MAG TPA: serine/threonine-protein kinase [Kofleriaceae bacterium]|nr:serine/threonine-protein kinase [Kofleriaceae bacterium]